MIPRFTATSLTTKTFKWLHTEAWNDDLNSRFVQFRQAPPVGLFTAVPFEPGRRRTPPTLVGRWLLQDGQGAVLGAVEAQGYWRGFRSLHVLVSDCVAPGGWQGEWLDALSFMISGLFVITEADMVRVFPMGKTSAEQIAASDFGTAKPVWTPYRDIAQTAADALGLMGPGGMSMAIVDCDPATWWQRPTAMRDRVALAYLEKRRDLAERREQLQQYRKPRAGGFLTRFASLFSRRS